VRIVGGQWRGRRLIAPPGRSTRPTADRVREALFGVVESLLMSGRWRPGVEQEEAVGPLAGLAVMDVFAGSGAVGLEALSRGAASCTFVEAGRPAVAALRRNLAALDVPGERVRVIAREAGPALREEAAAGRRYTLVFADPPYASYPGLEELLETGLPALLEAGGLAGVETARRVEPHLPLTPVVSKLYGDTRLTFLMAQ